jgi:hypothetical protein
MNTSESVLIKQAFNSRRVTLAAIRDLTRNSIFDFREEEFDALVARVRQRGGLLDLNLWKVISGGELSNKR